ncbi:MAG: hypothetical protein D8M58_18105 [Calditrichaeota bacterium]|nr:MAG: hypothetical protein DWQ03_11335 [Calditrichota bacterium]MBL1207323.1 hypothetical protein [Calditrichota bacterium]NOG47155.1 hypothetical protein [Calditrichota bacterium]
MNYIIDGFNLGFKIDHIAQNIKKGQTDLAIKQIIRFVLSKIKSPGKKIIVFDGREQSGQSHQQMAGIKLIFSRKPQTADDIIRDFIRKTKNIENWFVVSSDNEIIFTAQDLGAKAIKSDQFLKQSAAAKKNKTHIQDKKSNPENVDVDYWKKLFEAGNDSE